eukprot:7698690-Heterocapsa_arctica.AAC.1
MGSLRGTTMSGPSRTIKCPEKWLPKVTTGIELTAKGWEKYGPKLTPSNQWAPRLHNPYSG